jgi:hypothetical protein
MNVPALLCLASLVSGFLGCNGEASEPTVTIRDRTWKVRVALTDGQKYKGLSGESDLPEDEGMLFINRHPRVMVFCMRGCDHPLDIVFIDENLRVVQTHQMKVEESRRGDASYDSRVPAQYALEVKGGTIEEAGISIGDKVELSAGIPDPAKADP